MLGRAAVAEGTAVVFGVVDQMDAPVVQEACARAGVRCMFARTAHGAVAMADGYSRASGRVGVCVLGMDLALTSGATALVTAVRRRSRVVVLTEDVCCLSLAGAVGAAVVTVGSGDARSVMEDLRVAFESARLGVPAVLQVPRGVVVASGGAARYVPTLAGVSEQRVRPDPLLVARAVELIGRCERPVVLAGRGAVVSGAGGDIAGLADCLGAPLATTLQAKGLFAGHEHAIGIAGGFGTAASAAVFARADCVIAFGASLNYYQTKKGRLFADARVIQVERDADRVGNALDVDIALLGDARAAVGALVEGLGGGPSRSAWFVEGYQAAEAVDDGSAAYVEADDGLDPREVMDIFERALPADRTVVLDAGHFTSFAIDAIGVPDPAAFIDCCDFGSISIALALSIGAAVGAPGRRCIAFMGDGAFTMTAAELDTVARYGVPLTVIVINDNAYGGELRQLEMKGTTSPAVLFANPDFADLARSFGLNAERITDATRLAEIASQDQQPTGQPLFLDVIVTQSVRFRYHPLIEEMRAERERQP